MKQCEKQCAKQMLCARFLIECVNLVLCARKTSMKSRVLRTLCENSTFRYGCGSYDYLADVMFFARAKLVQETSHELKIFLRISFEQYFMPREPNNHIKVMILRLEWHKISIWLINIRRHIC